MDLKGYYLSSEVAKKIGIAQSNFSQIVKNSEHKKDMFKKVGNMLFLKFDEAKFKRGQVVYSKNIDEGFNRVLPELTTWENKFPSAAFVEDINLSWSNVQNLAKIEDGAYIKLNKTDDGKLYVEYGPKFKELIKEGFVFYGVTKEELDDLNKSGGVKGQIQIKPKVYLVCY